MTKRQKNGSVQIGLPNSSGKQVLVENFHKGIVYFYPYHSTKRKILILQLTNSIEQLTKLNNTVEEKRPKLTNETVIYSIIDITVLTLHHLITFRLDFYKISIKKKLSFQIMPDSVFC